MFADLKGVILNLTTGVLREMSCEERDVKETFGDPIFDEYPG